MALYGPKLPAIMKRSLGGRRGHVAAHRVPGYGNYATFQPAFGSPSLWDPAAALTVIWATRRYALSGGQPFMLAAACYAAGGFAAQSLLIGPMPQILGVPASQFAEVVVFAGRWLVYTSCGPKGPHQRGRILKLIW